MLRHFAAVIQRWSVPAILMAVAWMGTCAEAAYVDTVLGDPDLIAYYRLNETSGSDAFDAGGTHDAGYVGSIPGDNMAGPRPGDSFKGLEATNTAPSFDFDSVLLPSAPFDRDVVSVAGFLKTPGPTGSWRRLYTTHDGATHTLAVAAQGDEMLIEVGLGYPNATHFDNVSGLTDNQWHHWALVRNGTSTPHFYLDGRVLPSDTLLNLGIPADSGPRIGMRGTTDSSFAWQGGIDEVAFFDRALDPSEVRDLYYDARGVDPEPGRVVAHEPFAYEPGELHGQDGGLGFDDPWTADTTATEVVDVATPLAFDTGAMVIDGGERALEMSANVQPAASRNLEKITTDDVFVRFLVRWDEGTVDDNDFASLFLGTGSPTEPSIGVKGDRGHLEDGPEDFYVRFTPGEEQYVGEITDNETTHMVVGRLFKSGGTGNYDRFSLWVDPSWADQHAPDRTVSGDAGFDSLSAFGLKVWNLDGDDSVLFDELRLGQTWGEVVPAPEPGAAVVWLMGIVALLGCRARRRS